MDTTSDAVPVGGVMLRTDGNDLIVEMKIDGQWVQVIRACEGRSAETLSYLVEPAGLIRAAQQQAHPIPAWQWAVGKVRQ